MSEIYFPGLETLRLAIWTCYFRVFPMFLGNFSKFLGTNFWAKFPEILPIFPLKAAICVRKYMSGLVGLPTPRVKTGPSKDRSKANNGQQKR